MQRAHVPLGGLYLRFGRVLVPAADAGQLGPQHVVRLDQEVVAACCRVADLEGWNDRFARGALLLSQTRIVGRKARRRIADGLLLDHGQSRCRQPISRRRQERAFDQFVDQRRVGVVGAGRLALRAVRVQEEGVGRNLLPPPSPVPTGEGGRGG